MKEQRGFPAQDSEYLKIGDVSERQQEEDYLVSPALAYPLHDIEYWQVGNDLEAFRELVKLRNQEHKIHAQTINESIQF